ncbi:MAG TPA: S-layer homology domain-containing protein [Candidatus Ornithomonoglobus merdipullorum]|uniref:S-layer homology domain-containing protein n=1 Tax=Candidatus Ornithomonoglobus merdipullorum TaxID=2840895 RepID=A0A9D1MDV0_9FIRM|nr:S-layer homology domain-containing protein [Candidatus Ornithomonoglobus merdipullorum]
MKILAAAALALLAGTSVLAYTGQSDWADETLRSAEANNIMPYVIEISDVSMPVTRAEFAAVAVRLYDAMSDVDAEAASYNPFTDTADRDVLKAYAAGITTGVTDTTFEPDSYLSREQAATMLARVYSLVENREPSPSYSQLFNDDANISEYARASVYFMSENGIISGIGENMFGPDDTASREQAVVIAERMFEKFRPELAATPIPEVTPAPGTTQSPVQTESPEEGDMLSRIPVPGFGTVTETSEDEYSAEMTVEGVTLEDFEAYSQTVEGLFPIHVNNLENAFVIKSDGEYDITVNYGNGIMTVSIERAG